jgi:hypothetical protein
LLPGNNAGVIRRNSYRTDLLNAIEIVYCKEEETVADQRIDGGKRE